MWKTMVNISVAALLCAAPAASAQDLGAILGSWNVTNTLSGTEWGTRMGARWSEKVQFVRSAAGAIGAFPSDRTEIKTDGRTLWLTCSYCVCAADRQTQAIPLVWSNDKRSFSFTYTTHSHDCNGPARRTTSAFSR